MTTTPKISKTAMNTMVIIKFFFKSGNKSVSNAPVTSITGATALNNIPADIIIRPTITDLTTNVEVDDNETGPTKNIITSNNAIPMKIHEYLVFSL
jgi:hypothetical protein